MRNIFKLACVLFCIVGLVPNLMGCNKINKITKSFSTMTRDEFGAKLVVGMSVQEVIAAVGTPDSTADSGELKWWYYKQKTVDPITGKVDSSIQVCFKNGKYYTTNY